MSKNDITLLESIIAKLPGHIYWKDKNCTYLGCNDAQAKSLGLNSRYEIVGKNDFDLPWKAQADKIRQADLAVINQGVSITVEEPATLMDGKIATFYSKKEPLRDKDNNVVGILGVSIDITEIKNYQDRLKKANQAKSNFLRIMSHELAAPVSNIINSLDIIKHFIEDEDLTKESIMSYIDLAKQEADLIKPKLDDVINYINFDDTNIISHKSGCDLLDLVSKVVEKNSVKKSANVQLDYKIAKNLPKRIIIDIENLYTVLNIIINNAFDYTKQGSITFKLEDNSESDKQGCWVRITIIDTGVGIHEEQLKTILHGFGKETEDNYGHYRKPSVRLPYAKLLIQHVLKGELTIQSELGTGTNISIVIPYDKENDDSSITNSKQQNQAISLKVLLVEDNDVSRRLECEMLRKLNCIIEEAATGHEAIIKANQQKFDFIFLDITLPDMNGIQVFESIQTTLCSSTPVVALTSVRFR